MRDTFLMSELKRGDRFEIVYRDGSSAGLPYEFHCFDGEFAKCVNIHPRLLGEPVTLSVPGAMVRLINDSDAKRAV